jgi:hypothetical protein
MGLRRSVPPETPMSVQPAATPFLNRKITGCAALAWLWLWTIVGYLSFTRFCLIGYCPKGGGLDRMNFIIGHDFVNIWASGRLALEGKLATVYSWFGYAGELKTMLISGIDRLGHYHFSYPPHIILLLLVFGFAPYFYALAIWTLSGAAAWVAAVRAGDVKLPAWAMLLLVLSPAAVFNAIAGQNGFFTAAFFLGGLYLSERAPRRAGVLIGLLTVKPHLGILIPFVLILRRNWACFISAAVTTAVLVMASYVFWGVEPWRLFITETVPNMSEMMKRDLPYIMMPGVYTTALMAKGGPSAGQIVVWGLLQAAVSAWVFFASLQAVRKEGITPRAVFMLSLAALLVTPYCFNYDMLAIMGAMAVYLAVTPALPMVVYFIYALLWALPMLVFEIKYAGLPFACMILLAAFATLALQRINAPSKSL